MQELYGNVKDKNIRKIKARNGPALSSHLSHMLEVVKIACINGQSRKADYG